MKQTTTRNIYLVTAGAYSDYRVICAFTKRKDAKAFVEKADSICEYDRYDIELKPLNAPPEEWVYTAVRMAKDGSVIKVWKNTFNDGTGMGYSGYDVDGNLYCDVNTDDEKRAIKVVNERRTMILAADQWGSKAFLRQLT